MSAPDIAIVGVGYTRQGRLPGVSPKHFCLEASAAAIADAGLKAADIDGILVQGNGSIYPVDVAEMLGIQPRYSSMIAPYGTTASMLAMQAALGIKAGVADVVLCCYGNSGFSLAGGGVRTGELSGNQFTNPFGMNSAAMNYAVVAQRHMHRYGTKREHLAAVALAARQWAQKNPMAQMNGRPFDLETYMQGRWVAEPLTVFDCCLQSDGGRAFIVTTAARAKSLRQKPVYLKGYAEKTLAGSIFNDPALISPAKDSLPRALAMAGLKLKDIDLFEVYDCFTPAIVITLEDYGLCPKGEGGPFVADGKLAPGGALPFNTSGGLLSEVYLHNWGHVTEAVLQLRGQGGERQAAKHETAVVGGNGGTFQQHINLVLTV